MGLFLNLIIAAPWSIINCTAGLLGLAGLLVGIPGSSHIVASVTWCNEKLAASVLRIAESNLSAWQADGPARLLLAAILVLILIAATRRAARVSAHYPLGV